MKLDQRITLLAQAIGSDIKALNIAKGDLTSLSTTNKNNLVLAINEVKSLAGNASGGVSNQDLTDAIANLRNELRGGAGAALDTFKELADAIDNDASFAASLATQMSNKVDFSSAQSLTAAQKLQACENIGIGDPDTDLVAVYNTAKA